MSKQTFEEVFHSYERHYQEKVMQCTWGHLSPEKDKAYGGHIVFGEDAYGQSFILDYEFKGLPDSPWFYDALQSFIWNQEMESGMLYQFTGTFENYEFKGKLEGAYATDVFYI